MRLLNREIGISIPSEQRISEMIRFSGSFFGSGAAESGAIPSGYSSGRRFGGALRKLSPSGDGGFGVCDAVLAITSE